MTRVSVPAAFTVRTEVTLPVVLGVGRWEFVFEAISRVGFRPIDYDFTPEPDVELDVEGLNVKRFSADI